MSNHTIQRIFKTYENYLASSPQPLKNRKAIHSITHCRTAGIGTSYYTCNEHNEVVQQHHSCRHRSCFLCAQKKRLGWIESQKKRLFNIPHFHVVFTLPHDYLALWRYNEALFTQLLFKASQQTLIELLGDKKYHGVTPGILMTLHTWGRQLTLHPHTHCLVTAGGLTSDGNWQGIDEFLLPVHVVKAFYRGKLQAFIREAFESGSLQLPDHMKAQDFWQLHKSGYRKEWNVRIEERYEHGKGVMLYLARYLKGGPINPKQIEYSSADEIRFRYLDHRDKRTKGLSLRPEEFLRRFLAHVPAMGLHMVRCYGLYATSSKIRHRQCVEKLGNLESIKTPGLTLQDMVLFCRTCGAAMRHAYSVWRRQTKGNSINKLVFDSCAGGFVQQGRFIGVANEPCQKKSREIPP